MEPMQLFIIGLLVLLIYLVFAFTYHVYKLESLIRSLFNDRVDFDGIMEDLEFRGGHKTKCTKCNRNDNTCGCKKGKNV